MPVEVAVPVFMTNVNVTTWSTQAGSKRIFSWVSVNIQFHFHFVLFKLYLQLSYIIKATRRETISTNIPISFSIVVSERAKTNHEKYFLHIQSNK